MSWQAGGFKAAKLWEHAVRTFKMMTLCME